MDAAQAFAAATLVTDDELYAFVHLPPAAITAAAGVLAEVGGGFSVLIADQDEVSLVLAQASWDAFARRLPDARTAGPYRLITFDLPLDLALTGFLALVSRTLSDAGVPILAYAAFERDHVLVPADRFDAARNALAAAQTALANDA
jgi:hypothetical protein